MNKHIQTSENGLEDTKEDGLTRGSDSFIQRGIYNICETCPYWEGEMVPCKIDRIPDDANCYTPWMDSLDMQAAERTKLFDEQIAYYKKIISHLEKVEEKINDKSIEADKAVMFVKHIKDHIIEMEIGGEVICAICEKTIDEIYDEQNLINKGVK